MNTKKQFKRFQDIIADKLELLKDFEYNEIPDELENAVIELNSIIYATKELTEIKEQEIEAYIYKEIGFTIDNLIDIENSFY